MKEAMRATLIASFSLGALVTAPVSAFANAQSQAATTLASVNVSVPAIQFDGSNCVNTPVIIDYMKNPSLAPEVTLTITVELRQAGSNDWTSTWEEVDFADPGTGQLRDVIPVCPSAYKESAGNYLVGGELYTYLYRDGSDATTPLSAAEVQVVKNPATITSMKISRSGSNGYQVAGKATALTVSKGDMGAAGKITSAVKKPGSRSWQQGPSTIPNGFGEWSLNLGKQTKGTQVKVDLTECGWCSNATRTAKITK